MLLQAGFHGPSSYYFTAWQNVQAIDQNVTNTADPIKFNDPLFPLVPPEFWVEILVAMVTAMNTPNTLGWQLQDLLLAVGRRIMCNTNSYRA